MKRGKQFKKWFNNLFLLTIVINVLLILSVVEHQDLSIYKPVVLIGTPLMIVQTVIYLKHGRFGD